MSTPTNEERPPVADEGPLGSSDGSPNRNSERSADVEGAERSRTDWALWYAAAGWHVHPLKPGQKIPLTEHGHLDATLSTYAIRTWWSRWPDANIGVALEPSGIAVLDIDPRNGGNLAALHAAVDCGSPLVARTGSGGWHYLYGDRGVDLRSKLTHLGLDGIDVKRNGYIVVAPSVTKLGAYTWIDGDDVVLGGEFMPSMVLDLCRAPAHERDLVTVRTTPLDLREQRYVAAAVDNICQRVARARVGERHDITFAAACQLGEFIGGGVLDRHRAETQLKLACLTLYGEALEPSVERDIRDGLNRGITNPRDVPDEHTNARRILDTIAEADDPMRWLELYAENSPEIVRDMRASTLINQRDRALRNVYAVAGEPGFDRFAQLLTTA